MGIQEWGVKAVEFRVRGSVGARFRVRGRVGKRFRVGVSLKTDSEKNIAHFSQPVASSSLPTPH